MQKILSSLMYQKKKYLTSLNHLIINQLVLIVYLIIPDLIVKPLCRLINNSFTRGLFPDFFKIVKVIPIHKGNSNQDMNNYRLISLLSIFDKIIEKLMHKRLYDFLEINNILYEKQYGFRKKKKIC